MKRFYLLTALFALTAAGCVKDELVDASTPPLPENLTVEQTDYTLDAFEKRTATAAFSAKGDWTLSIVYDNDEAGDETDADAAWLTADVAGGAAGEQSVGMSAARNFQASPRTAYVDLLCGEQTVRLTVTQTGLSDDMDFSALFDETFAQKLQELGHISNAENITLQEMQNMATITVLLVSGTSSNPGALTSLQGIEYFESLTYLTCSYNRLTSLDISKNTALTYLTCSYNQLTSLDISKNTALTDFSCDDNQLTALDVSKNTALTSLYCSDNQLTSLDFSQNTALGTLSCYNNQLTSLDISKNTALTDFSCDDNQLTALDVSKNTALTSLYCSDNQLTSLDFSQNTALGTLSCYNNQLTSLDISKNTALIKLSCYNNQLTSLDVSDCTALRTLWCYSNQLTSLDVSKNTALSTLQCYSNQLTSLDISQNTALAYLYCSENPGDGVSKFPVTAWFDNADVPGSLRVPKSSWLYNGNTIAIDFQKAPL